MKHSISSSCSDASPCVTKQDEKDVHFSYAKMKRGWKAMPFILGNETFERLATVGLLSNFMVYLMNVYHMEQVSASNVLSLWSGFTNFAPLVGAFISDVYVGRFKTIAFASFATLLGLITMTLTAWLPHLHPSACSPNEKCQGHTAAQLGILALGLCFLSIGSAGIRPCSIPFGVDQFDTTTDEGKKGVASYYNWYYTTFTIVLLIAQTVITYIQVSVSWVLGFAIPTILMIFAIILFFLGTKLYFFVTPEGSIFSGIAQVFVAAYKKRGLKIPSNGELVGTLYDPSLKGSVRSKLHLTTKYRFLTKAAVIVDDSEVNSDGLCAKPWKLVSIQQVEEVKCLIKVISILVSVLVALIPMVQQGTFAVSQALKMDRHIGPKFEIPAGSLSVISLLTVAIWLPIYDRIVIPSLRKITKQNGGITLLQRIGIGIVFTITAMIAAGLCENKRRSSANMEPSVTVSVMWLSPQLILMGFAEAFTIIGLIEFLNRQFPEHMTSIANSLFGVTFAVASYLSTAVVNIIHNVTGRHDRPDWLTNNINAGKLDYFYYTLAAMGVVNFFYFLYRSSRYVYKGSIESHDELHEDLELNSIKSG